MLASGRRDALRALLRREPTCSIDVMYSAEFLDQPLLVPPRAEAQLLAHDDRVRPRPVHPPRFGKLLRIAISAFPSGVGTSRRIAMRRTSICLPSRSMIVSHGCQTFKHIALVRSGLVSLPVATTRALMPARPAS